MDGTLPTSEESIDLTRRQSGMIGALRRRGLTSRGSRGADPERPGRDRGYETSWSTDDRST
jgi:hypothetical protein